MLQVLFSQNLLGTTFSSERALELGPLNQRFHSKVSSFRYRRITEGAGTDELNAGTANEMALGTVSDRWYWSLGARGTLEDLHEVILTSFRLDLTAEK